MGHDIAISVKNIKKDFVLPHEKSTSIKSSIVNIFKSKERHSETQHALRGISFDIEKGEFFGILGRNGSGKSTLLKILAEIYQPTSGKVQVRGKLVPFIELGVGFNPELTGRENVYLNGALLGFSRQEIDERYEDIVAFAELEEFMDQKLKNYSSGMQVRLAFSVATRAEADILLVDEVLAVGDADFQRKCYNYFKSLKKTGKTVVFVTHDMGAVREYCDRAVLVNEGKITHDDTADRVADEYLKLFNTDNFTPPTDSEEPGEESSRWGNGDITVKSVKVSGDTQLRIDIEVESHTEETMESINLGLRVQNQTDQVVAGTGIVRLLEGEKLNFMPKDKKKITYTMPNIFGRGEFMIGTILMKGDGVTVLDDWKDAAQIKNNQKDSFYPILLPARVEITDESRNYE